MLWRWCWDNMQTWSTDAQNNRSEPNVKEEVMGRLARHFFPPPNLWTNNLNNSLNNKVIGFWLLFKYTWLRNLSKDAGREKPSSEEKTLKQHKWIIHLNHIKSSRLLPDGSQTGTSAPVVVSMPHWTPASMQRFPQVPQTLFFSIPLFVPCRVVWSARWPQTQSLEVLHVGRKTLTADSSFYFPKREGENVCLLVFHSVTHPTQSPTASIKSTQAMHCRFT